MLGQVKAGAASFRQHRHLLRARQTMAEIAGQRRLQADEGGFGRHSMVKLRHGQTRGITVVEVAES